MCAFIPLSSSMSAISRFTSMSSTRSSLIPLKSRPHVLSAALSFSESSPAAPMTETSVLCSSDGKIGLLQNPFTPASTASPLISGQSYAVIRRIGVSFPTALRICRAASIPFRSGSRQSMMNSIICSWSCRYRIAIREIEYGNGHGHE